MGPNGHLLIGVSFDGLFCGLCDLLSAVGGQAGLGLVVRALAATSFPGVASVDVSPDLVDFRSIDSETEMCVWSRLYGTVSAKTYR
jgi:hypothetical protein